MSFLSPSIPTPPPPPKAPPEPDLGKAAAMAEEAEKTARGRRKGRGSTVIAGALGKTKDTTGQQPTLMG